MLTSSFCLNPCSLFVILPALCLIPVEVYCERVVLIGCGSIRSTRLKFKLHRERGNCCYWRTEVVGMDTNLGAGKVGGVNGSVDIGHSLLFPNWLSNIN